MLTSDGESSNAVHADNIDCGGPPNRTGNHGFIFYASGV